MATIHLDDTLYRRIQASAEANGTTPEVEAARVLDERFSPSVDDGEEHRRQALLRMVERFRSQPIDPGPDYPGSVEFIRQMREEREADLDRAVRGEK